jgi:hypothetical protein
LKGLQLAPCPNALVHPVGEAIEASDSRTFRRAITEFSDSQNVLVQTVNRVGNQGSSEHRSDTGEKFIHLQWFGQEIIGSGLQTRLDAMTVRLTSDDDDGDLLRFSNRLDSHAECQSVDVGHTPTIFLHDSLSKTPMNLHLFTRGTKTIILPYRPAF